jgi:two-component system chemotaxis response regulator CheB
MLSSPKRTQSHVILPYTMIGFGGSAGAISVLKDILSRLPAALPVPIVVVQHMNADWPSELPSVLGHRSALECRWAKDGEAPRPGVVHVAPPGRNLVVTSTASLKLINGRKSRMGWPSADMFMLSMAEHVGAQAIGIILSGMLYDGAEGISALRRAGGATIVQHPETAQSRSMPEAAIDLGRADLSRSPAQIAEAISILVEHGVE